MPKWRLLAIVVAGVALAATLTYITALIWPPPHPFW
jgi:hypothetical protein